MAKRSQIDRTDETKAPAFQQSPFSLRHLLGIEKVSANDLTYLLDLAEEMIEVSQKVQKQRHTLTGRTQINLFFENSTRTQASFEIAGKRLGMDVMNMAVAHSSVAKGETLLDTALTLNAMKPDLLVVRHHSSGAADLLAQKVDCAVINAGDGSHEHPTQALLDALSIRRAKKSIEGLQIAICGDIAHSRVARSNIQLLHTLGARLRVIGPTTLIPSGLETLGVEVFHRMEDGLKDCDVVMMLRLQKERMTQAYIPSMREFYHFYGLDKHKLAFAKEDAIVLHPAPMNRGIEIASEVADGPQSVIFSQVEMGVAVRMAAIEALLKVREAEAT